MSTTTVSPSTRADTVRVRLRDRRISILGSSGSVGSADVSSGEAPAGSAERLAGRGAGGTPTTVDHPAARPAPRCPHTRPAPGALWNTPIPDGSAPRPRATMTTVTQSSPLTAPASGHGPAPRPAVVIPTPVEVEPTSAAPARPGATPAVRATLRPGTVVVARDGRTVQVGLAPDRAVIVEAPAELDARRLAALLNRLDGDTDLDAAARRAGIDTAGRAAVARILVGLAELGHVHLDTDRTDALPPTPSAHPARPRPAPVRRVHILGVGQVSEVLRGPLSVNGCRVSTGPAPGLGLDAERPPWLRRGQAPDLVILTGAVAVDPVLTTALGRAGQTHMHVYCRDGRVVVGPTVLPGRTTCLRCADLFRAHRDPRWPVVAAQLIGRSPDAGVPALTAAAALVLAEVSATREPHGRMQTIGATVEINPAEGLWRRLEWPAAPGCECGAAPGPRPLS